MMMNVTITSQPAMKYNKSNDPYITFCAVENSTKSNPKTYIIIVYNKHSLKLAYLYLKKGNKVTLEGKLKSSDKTEQCFIMENIGPDFLQKIYF